MTNHFFTTPEQRQYSKLYRLKNKDKTYICDVCNIELKVLSKTFHNASIKHKNNII